MSINTEMKNFLSKSAFKPGKREFNPRLCCKHDWSGPDLGEELTRETCLKCGAECSRDKSGDMVEYTRYPGLFIPDTDLNG